MIRRGQRSRLALSNRAIITYQRHRSSGAVGSPGRHAHPPPDEHPIAVDVGDRPAEIVEEIVQELEHRQREDHRRDFTSGRMTS